MSVVGHVDADFCVPKPSYRMDVDTVKILKNLLYYCSVKKVPQ